MTLEPDSDSATSTPLRPQFGLGAMLGCFVAMGMALAYLRKFDSVQVFQNGLIALVLAALCGLIVGSLTGRRRETTFWSVLISAAGYISVVGETHYGAGFHFAWSAVGATAGAAAAAVSTGLPRRMVLSCLSGSAPMLIYFAFFSQRAGLEFDLLAAAVVGALIGLLVEIIMWLERQSRIPRYVTASWLLSAVIIGNLMVPMVLA